MTQKTESKELTTRTEYAITTMSAEQQEVMQANLGSTGLSPFDLPRIKVPTGGGQFWTVERDGEEKPEAEIECIVVAWHDGRQYYKEKFGGGEGSGPPDCSSNDLVTGSGDIGDGATSRPCATCPMNQWGTATDQAGKPTKGKACQERRALLFVEPQSTLPTLLMVPPGSLKGVRKDFTQLASRGHLYCGVTARLTLEKATNAQGIDYSQVKILWGDPLSKEQIAAVRGYAKTFGATMAQAMGS